MANTRAQKTAQNLSTLTTAGDIAYASAAGTPARLGIGSSAQVLTVASGVPSWATPSASASGLTKITSASFSAVANTSTTFDGVFTSTYNNYLVVMSNLLGTLNANFLFQYRTSGPTTKAADYYGSKVTDITLTNYSNTSSVTLFSLSTETSSLNMNVAIDATPTQMSYICSQRSSSRVVTGAGMNDTTGANAATGFILSTSTGTISGFVAVYGLAD